LKIKECIFADDVLNDIENNMWVRFEDEVAIIGINPILVWISGVFSSVSFKSIGTEIARGMNVGAIESALHFDVVKSPLTGILVETNNLLKQNPKILNKDPFNTGWFAKLKPVKMEERKFLVETSQARLEFEKKIGELNIRCFSEFPDYEMYEIGTECSAALTKLDELLSKSELGTVVHLVSDDPVAGIELVRWSDRTGNLVLESRKEVNLEHFIVKKAK
jgi:glycine cleavage system H lipoate-binding protein/TusA-related sulfurtransferase